MTEHHGSLVCRIEPPTLKEAYDVEASLIEANEGKSDRIVWKDSSMVY